jgi:pimeloyl-ACP methyl ester carboxylesterase
MFFFLERGYRVIAHDRRGHGRSTQTACGNEMNTYAADVHELVQALDLRGAIHIGHSTGGGEAARYVALYGKGRVSKLVLISAVPPVMLKSEKNPGGLSIEVFDEIREGTAKHRAQYYQDLTLPFYGYNRANAKVSEAVRHNWWRQAMDGGIKPQFDCIKAFSETDFTEDLSRSKHRLSSGMGGRSDRALRRRGPALGETSQELGDEVLPRISAWDACDARRSDQRRSACIHRVLMSSDNRWPQGAAAIGRSPAPTTPRRM